MENQNISIVAQIISAIGMILVSILAIWGEKIRKCFFGPKLELKVKDFKGNLTKKGNRKIIYYHLKVKNTRKGSLAKHVRVLLTSISRKTQGTDFIPEPLAIPVQLQWSYPSFHEQFPNIPNEDYCDIGSIEESNNVFNFSLYVRPNNVFTDILANHTVRIKLSVEADNFYSETLYILEIYWDGEWHNDPDEMQKHLVIKEIE